MADTHTTINSGPSAVGVVFNNNATNTNIAAVVPQPASAGAAVTVNTTTKTVHGSVNPGPGQIVFDSPA